MPSPIGTRLAKARILGGLSSRELGRLANLSETAPALIEAGKRTDVAAGTVAELAAVLGVTTDWLILGRGESPTAESVTAAVKRARRRRSEAAA